MGLRRYASLARGFSRTLRGRSYYHVGQPVGTRFDRSSLRGYYNDLTAKADWPGERDRDGLPLVALSNGERVYFPITIAQMALGDFERWLASGQTDAVRKNEFLNLSRWLLRSQDDRGGWENPWRFIRPSCVSGYSAMAQGQAISVLVRACAMTGDAAFLGGARLALGPLVATVPSGGCSYIEGDRIYLEELPEVPRSTVLNGWIFAIFGLHDLSLVAKDTEAKAVFERTVATLRESLDSYDAGYWSFHDVQKRIASPYYHALHIAQLESLWRLTSDLKYQRTADRWRSYQSRRVNFCRAFGRKIWQKLRSAEPFAVED